MKYLSRPIKLNKKEPRLSPKTRKITDMKINKINIITNTKDINKRVIESLIKCGGFDEMGYNRASLMMGYEKVLESVSLERKKNIKNGSNH